MSGKPCQDLTFFSKPSDFVTKQLGKRDFTIQHEEEVVAIQEKERRRLAPCNSSFSLFGKSLYGEEYPPREW